MWAFLNLNCLRKQIHEQYVTTPVTGSLHIMTLMAPAARVLVHGYRVYADLILPLSYSINFFLNGMADKMQLSSWMDSLTWFPEKDKLNLCLHLNLHIYKTRCGKNRKKPLSKTLHSKMYPIHITHNLIRHGPLTQLRKNAC